jgi:cyclophilin family peptidyl-prolyl cis-trans isomerase
VEFKMRFAQDQEDPNKFHYFVVELDADNMPHAVFTFLTLVDRGSFHPSDDGTHFSFHHNGAHIVSGSPMNHKDWNDLMLYQEYSENAPHEQYTMGWSALGPNLYFNLRDNNERDGNIRDPCFGRVVFGWSVVERMHKSTGSLEEESWKEMDDPVKVISIDFVRNN